MFGRNLTVNYVAFKRYGAEGAPSYFFFYIIGIY